MAKQSVKTTKVRKRRRLKVSGVLFLVFIAFCIYLGIKYVNKIEATNISVKGNSFLSDSSIIKDAGLESSMPYLSAKNSTVCNTLKKNPIIGSCKVKHNLDFSITIEVTENKPLFYYLSDNKMVLADGEEAELENTYGVPTLINYVPKKILKQFVSGLSKIDDDIIKGISEIEYSPSQNSEGKYIDEGRFMLSMNDTNTVYVNTKHMNVLGYYKKIYASIGDRKGIYYFDCDYDNYYFEEYQ